MKKIIGGALIILTIYSINIAHVNASVYYTNNNGVKMTEEEYNKVIKKLSEEKVSELGQEDFNKYTKGKKVSEDTIYSKIEYNEKGILSETSISKEEYDLAEDQDKYLCKTTKKVTRSDDQGFIETSYKKLFVELDDMGNNKFDLFANLTWKKVPACRSYDVFAFRLAHMSYSHVMGEQTYYISSGHSNIYYNSTSEGYKSSSSGAGFSMNLKDGSNITKYEMFLSADLEISDFNYSTARVWTTYQHAQNDLTRAQSMSYTFDGMGLGDVVYYSNNYIANMYDDMAGIQLTTPIP